MGGNFKDGFIGVGVGALLSPMTGALNKGLGFGSHGDGGTGWQFLGRTATAGVVGGTATAISGGKFGNGAVTAAFMHVVNEEAPGAIGRRKQWIIDGKSGGDFSVGPRKQLSFFQRLFGGWDGPRGTSFEYPELGKGAVSTYKLEISTVSQTLGIDERLLKTIIYMENSRGWYDDYTSAVKTPKSPTPSNINLEYWGDAFGDPSLIRTNGLANIRAGGEMLRRITMNLTQGYSVAQAATLYHSINSTRIDGYGLRAQSVYDFGYYQ